MESQVQLLMPICSLLMRNGIKSMTMDDIARGMGISKKTLYNHFSNKADLVCLVLKNYLEEEKKAVGNIFGSGFNAIEEMFAISRHVSMQITDMHPSIHYDLEKYYPEAWQVFMDYKFHFVYSSIIANLDKGISEGLYRENMDIKIIAKIYISRMDIIFDPQYFHTSEFKFSDVLNEMTEYHIRGIASKQGIKYMVKRFKNANPELI